MADTTFTAYVTRIVSTWLTDINNYVYRGLNPSYVTSTGSANAQVITITGALETSLTAGQKFVFKAGYSNTSAMTLQAVLGSTTTTAAAVNPASGTALTANQVLVGSTYTVIWNGTYYELQGAIAGAGDTLAVATSMVIPAGTTGARPSGSDGNIRYNTTTAKFEGYGNSAWSGLGGGATGAGTDTVFNENSLIVTSNYTLSTNKSANSVGPITINSGVTVTIPSGYRWVIL